MHVYIYDDYVNAKKYDTVLAQIETRITDLGLNGKIIRLDVMKNVAEAVASEIKRGAKTIIAVGNDQTINKIINSVALFSIRNQTEVDIPLGLITVGDKSNNIAPALGIEFGEKGCDALSARRIAKLDIGLAQVTNASGQISNFHFISQANIACQETLLEIEPLKKTAKSKFSIEVTDPGEISIINLPTVADIPSEVNANPQDGKLELYIKTKTPKKLSQLSSKTSQSVFSSQKINVINEKRPLILDGSLKVDTPAEITVLSKKLNFIVGKERNF